MSFAGQNSSYLPKTCKDHTGSRLPVTSCRARLIMGEDSAQGFVCALGLTSCNPRLGPLSQPRVAGDISLSVFHPPCRQEVFSVSVPLAQHPERLLECALHLFLGCDVSADSWVHSSKSPCFRKVLPSPSAHCCPGTTLYQSWGSVLSCRTCSRTPSA